MAQRKPYNPHTAYGRRKIREQQDRERQERWDKMTPAERVEHEKEMNKIKFQVGLFFFVLFIIVSALIILIGGFDAWIKWLK